jgi:hypothetical protein
LGLNLLILSWQWPKQTKVSWCIKKKGIQELETSLKGHRGRTRWHHSSAFQPQILARFWALVALSSGSKAGILATKRYFVLI